MKISLQSGICGGRWTCRNINKKVCKPDPQENKNFVECRYYEKEGQKKSFFRAFFDDMYYIYIIIGIAVFVIFYVIFELT